MLIFLRIFHRECLKNEIFILHQHIPYNNQRIPYEFLLINLFHSLNPPFILLP